MSTFYKISFYVMLAAVGAYGLWWLAIYLFAKFITRVTGGRF